MDIKKYLENAETIKSAFKETLKEDSSTEEIERVNKLVSVVDNMVKDHTEQNEENAKLTKYVVNMVKTQGNDIKPNDNDDGSKPKSFEEIMSEFNKEDK